MNVRAIANGVGSAAGTTATTPLGAADPGVVVTGAFSGTAAGVADGAREVDGFPHGPFSSEDTAGRVETVEWINDFIAAVWKPGNRSVSGLRHQHLFQDHSPTMFAIT